MLDETKVQTISMELCKMVNFCVFLIIEFGIEKELVKDLIEKMKERDLTRLNEKR